MSLLLRRNLLPSLLSSAQGFSHSMRFRHLHRTITDGQRQNTSQLFEPPANKPPARPSSSDFTHSDMVKCTIAIRHHMRKGQCDTALLLFNSMPRRSEVTYGTMISGYFSNGESNMAQQLFDEMPVKNLVSQCIMMKWNIKYNNLKAARLLFDELPVKDVVAWTTILTGYIQNGLMDEGKRIFDKMPDKDVFSWNTILSGYIQNGLLDEAMRVFDEMPVKNAVSWNTILSGYMQNGLLDKAKSVFDEMPVKNVVSWTTIIIGYARHGFGEEALQHFESMKQASIQPDELTMVGVLTACSHSGLIDKGKHYFYSMSQDHGIVPNICHYSCLIGLLGRAGRLDEAQNLMKSMPFEPNAVTWSTLLSACRVHGNTKLGEKAAEMLFDLEPWNCVPYVTLSNLYAASGRWEDVKKTRLKMKDQGISNRRGYSWVEVRNKIHKFSVGDFTHPDSESIRAFLEELYLRMKEEGYVSSTKSALHDVDEEEKQHTLKFHSERLAVAYGIMKIPSGRPVRIFKNLRVCEDCHMAIKHIAKIAGRLIILRDTNRFHYFEGGVCNCGDYW
ncbi:pentatricopeptide repeat-containing protein At4g02750-like [Salvia miltiorrhiza]|uniref:pentatricopeptide repeat-containing protein At4g02750-like n=1 Tax=Salvia miltiorrhiza TaxID=226208 RepID=UPI0025AC5E80|nr:pentatricopeptide repeat-containing protein At4g02750-like [Salvia miltiorrhiza]XP_057810464.1 pentatricopeptide repeat-containing protein At4g02750-like [Salvia miltiorrhiza]